ncbi:hypothetical protein V5799_003015 [Amblyomma americanum]|uniref:Evasin n=1 Tax=Amblyomma americanum TaxID=6943 RepID=A0AAQ4DA62_AMBAM
MHLEALLAFLLVFIGSVACQELTDSDEDSVSTPDFNVTNTDGSPSPHDYVVSNESIEISTSEVTSTEATTTTSAATTTTSVSTTVESPSAATTRKERTRRPRPTKRTKRPRPAKGQHGTLIDKNGCKHKVLESNYKLYTGTCTGMCAGRIYPIVDGTECLLIGTFVHERSGTYVLGSACAPD